MSSNNTLTFKCDFAISQSGVKCPVGKKKRDSIEVTEAETFATYSQKLKEKYGENWLGKGKCTGLEFKRWLALRDNKTEIP
jgi:hypothetical protein